MYLFFDNVPSNPKAEIKMLKLPSPSEPGAGRCRLVQVLHRGAETGLVCPVSETFGDYISKCSQILTFFSKFGQINDLKCIDG